MGLDNLARAGVNDARTIGIFDFCRQIAQHRIAGIFQTHVGIVLGQNLGGDGILETCGLESHVPVVDTLNKIGNPLLGSGRIYIIDNLLLGLSQFAAQIFLLVLGHQTVAGDERLVLGLVLCITESHVAIHEVTHAVVPQTFAHRLFREKYHGRVEGHGDGSCL